jgi:predicted metalloprotease
MTLRGNDHPRDRGLLWWILAVTTLTVIGSVGIVVFGAPDRSSVTVGLPSPAPVVTPEPSSEPIPPGESVLHTMVIPGDGACPNFRQRRHQVPDAELKGYLSSMLDCLMDVHAPAFAEAGLTLRRPELAPETEVDGSGCVDEIPQPSDWAGLYCPANITIYYRTDWAPDEPVQYVDVLIHEFNHHLQNETGILAPITTEQEEARAQPNGDIRVQELSRRVELHAECLTGVIVGPQGPLSVSSRQLDDLVEFRSSVPPEWAATHGSGRAQTRWFERGAYADGPHRYAACNTFTAAAALVE